MIFRDKELMKTKIFITFAALQCSTNILTSSSTEKYLKEKYMNDYSLVKNAINYYVNERSKRNKKVHLEKLMNYIKKRFEYYEDVCNRLFDDIVNDILIISMPKVVTDELDDTVPQINDTKDKLSLFVDTNSLSSFVEEVKLFIADNFSGIVKSCIVRKDKVYYQTKNNIVADFDKKNDDILGIHISGKIHDQYKKNDNIFNLLFEDIGCKSKVIKETDVYCKRYVSKVNNALALIEIATQMNGECIVTVVFHPKKSEIKPYLTSETKSAFEGLKT